ncbi:MAG: 4Fe-4S dicluster domain-containing protein [Rhodobacterales bacterium]|nr:4Fe-4S dicluster domain-containing protein [Rhodobacterales bacterium]
MAFSINEHCVNCWACLPLCPSAAISANLDGRARFAIDLRKCTECDGAHAEPQCAAICPIEGAILDAAGAALNPPGSLTGIPPHRLAEAMAEIQAR